MRRSTKFRNESHSVRILEDLQSLRQNEVLCDARFEADDDQRKDLLSELMEHVRLPLLRPEILDNIAEESLLNNSPKCKDYVFEAIRFNLKKSFQHFTIPTTIRYKPRQFGGSQKVILLFNKSDTLPKCRTQWYDPTSKLQKNGPEMNDCRQTSGLGVIRDQFVFALGGLNMSSSKSVSMVDVSSQSPSWVPMVDMLITRTRLGVGVLDDRIYAVGGYDGTRGLNSVEVFDVSTQKWRMVTSMTSNKWDLGVGVLNNRLYAIGGGDKNVTNSVEYYDPTLDSWTPVSNMSTNRQGAGVGVLDGVLYAIGGYTGSANLKSVEAYRPSEGVWSPIVDMHMSRKNPGVIALDGLLFRTE
ncbi:unnamed protein product [Macrosiphum euphorbiae]|uniref:Uncharacterized protein n=1 Tax=Macrosiphum euphorbiae TaxID=13131 RepID=A0AAV0VW43_9HEMI|nr:unnamed protein product [Macrosiphum euphorbiae]